MSTLARVLLLSCAVAFILAIVAADEVTASTMEPTPFSEGQTREPEEPEKTEAPAETDGTTIADNAMYEATTEEMLPISFAGADRSLTEKMSPGGSSHGDSSNSDSSNSEAQNSDSFNVDPTNADLLPLNEETPSGPAGEVPEESVESQESVDIDVDSEESFTSPGAVAALK